MVYLRSLSIYLPLAADAALLERGWIPDICSRTSRLQIIGSFIVALFPICAKKRNGSGAKGRMRDPSLSWRHPILGCGCGPQVSLIAT